MHCAKSFVVCVCLLVLSSALAGCFSPPSYTARYAPTPPIIDRDWDQGQWRDANVLAVDRFHPKSKDHRPVTHAKVLYDDLGIYVHFRVEDRYVVSRNVEYQSPVWQDSSVEFFLMPAGASGYFNFEWNCGGALLLYYIEDTRPGDVEEFRKFTKVAYEDANTIGVYHTLPKPIDEPIMELVTWRLAFFVPWELIEKYAGTSRPNPGDTWHANFYKSAGLTPKPHWAAWSPIGSYLRFHQPKRFGRLVFE